MGETFLRIIFHFCLTSDKWMNEILPKKQKTRKKIVLVAMCLNIFLKDINTVSYHLWTCQRRDTFWSGSAGTGFGSCAWWDTFHSLRTSCNGYSAECCVWRNPGEGTRRIKSLKGVFCGNVSVYWTQRRNTVFVGSHLAAFTGVHAIMEPRCDVPAYLTQKHHTSSLCDKDTHA